MGDDAVDTGRNATGGGTSATMVSVNQSVIIGLSAGLFAVIAPTAWRTIGHRRSSPLQGSIGRVTSWAGGHGTIAVLSGPAKGTALEVHCAEPTVVGEHVVVVESSTTGWRVLHLDDADSIHSIDSIDSVSAAQPKRSDPYER